MIHEPTLSGWVTKKQPGYYRQYTGQCSQQCWEQSISSYMHASNVSINALPSLNLCRYSGLPLLSSHLLQCIYMYMYVASPLGKPLFFVSPNFYWPPSWCLQLPFMWIVVPFNVVSKNFPSLSLANQCSCSQFYVIQGPLCIQKCWQKLISCIHCNTHFQTLQCFVL